MNQHGWSSEELEAVRVALQVASAQKLAWRWPLDKVLEYASFWLEPESVRARIEEAGPVPDSQLYGFAFVRPHPPYLPEGGYKIGPVVHDGCRFPFLLIVIPAPIMELASALPEDIRALAVLERQAVQLREKHEWSGVPLPPRVAQFLKDLEGPQREEG